MKDRASSSYFWTYPQRCWRTRRALVARLGPSTTHTFTCQAVRRAVARTSVGAGEGWIATFGRTSRTAARAFRSRGSSIHPKIWPARPPGAAIAGSAQPDGLLRRHFSRFGSGSEYPIGFRSFGRGTRSGAPVRIVYLNMPQCRDGQFRTPKSAIWPGISPSDAVLRMLVVAGNLQQLAVSYECQSM